MIDVLVHQGLIVVRRQDEVAKDECQQQRIVGQVQLEAHKLQV